MVNGIEAIDRVEPVRPNDRNTQAGSQRKPKRGPLNSLNHLKRYAQTGEPAIGKVLGQIVDELV